MDEKFHAFIISAYRLSFSSPCQKHFCFCPHLFLRRVAFLLILFYNTVAVKSWGYLSYKIITICLI